MKRFVKDPNVKAIDTAGHLLEVGKKEKAKVIIQKVLNAHPQNKKIYSTVVLNYWFANMFKEAKEVFRLYRAEFGMDLKTDVTLEGLEEEEKRYVESIQEKGEQGIFKARLLWLKILIGLGLPSVIREVQVSPKGIVIKALYKVYHYEWKEILDAFVIELPSEGPTLKALVMRTADKNFELKDLYFEKGWVLLENTIPKYIKVSRRKYKEANWAILFSILFIFGLVSFIKIIGDWGLGIGCVIVMILYQLYLNRINKL